MRTGSENYTLYNECNKYLVLKNNSPMNMWPSFLWHLLSGGHLSQFHGDKRFYEVYGGKYLWSIIPSSMRPWWIEGVKDISDNLSPYADVNLNYPCAIFKDKTFAAKKYNDDFGSGIFHV